jgi:hypothetical protein
VIAAPNALIDEHHENLVLVAKENRAAAAHRGYGGPALRQRVYSYHKPRHSPSSKIR